MPTVRAQAEATFDAKLDVVYEVIADYATHHPQIMPESFFSGLEVDAGGIGAGTVFHITFHAPGKRERLHMRVDEPEPGSVLTETNLDS